MNNKFIMNNYNKSRQMLYSIPNFFDLANIETKSNNNLEDFGIRRPLLRLGDQGDEVVRLQENLIYLNYLSGSPDGIFGMNTEKAVRNFQKDMGLLQDGIVGNNTWNALENMLLEPLPTNRPVIKKGDKSFFVKEAQLKLMTLGFFTGNPDGVFEKDTEEAVKKFQQSQNITSDGIVGFNTWRALNRSFSATELPTPTLREPVSLGSIGDDVALLQTMLYTLNYFSGEIDSLFGKDTEQAVKEFQTDVNLPTTGVVDQGTWEVLERIILFPSNGELKEGATGNNVIILQEKLKELGYFSGSITGSFGYETEEAVQKFQTFENLPVTGIVDSATWDILYQKTEIEIPASTISVISRPTLRMGDSGDDVKYLQTLLKQLMYYDGNIDGVFGNSTNVAVRTFQTNNHLTADGIVGRNTWSTLIYLYSPLAICGYTNSKFVGVIVDAGHGGSDPGAVGNEIIEKEYNLKISQYMANRFRELGIPFAMTRTTDETLSNTERIRRMKEPFGDVSNAIVISNHINSGGGEGAEVIYALRNTPDLATDILNELGNSGQVKRKVYQRTLPSDPTKDYYYIMRDTNNLQTTIVEYGFLDNANDILRLQKNWDKYAEATVKAVTNYMGYPYTAPESGKITYVVVAGDTLWSIANRFNTTVEAIKSLNNLKTNNLSIGQQLFIPGIGVEPTPPSGNIIYIVKAGDTLWSIANRFNTTVEAIKNLNNLTTNNLSIGQQLFIPGVSVEIPETSPTVYTVAKGDTIWSIANKFNTTVANIKTWNNLTSDVLSIGQRLIVSQNNALQYTIHTVVKGDTLWAIATRFNTTVEQIKNLNNLTSNNLSIGQQLKIPL